MAQQTKYKGKTLSYKMAAGETLTALLFVKLASDTTIAAIAATTDLAIGVLLAKTAREDVSVPVQIDGVVDVLVGTGDVTRGNEVKITATGSVIDSAHASGDLIVGQALQSKVAGEYAKVHLTGICDVA